MLEVLNDGVKYEEQRTKINGNFANIEQSGILPWVSNVTFIEHAMTLGSDGIYYKSLVASNVAFDPAGGANPTKWKVATISVAEQAAIASNTALLANTMIKVGTAYIGGDRSGNARGNNALDIQTQRTGITRVASGTNAIAFGNRNTASGDYSSVFGFQNTASNKYANAFGSLNTASGDYSSVFGNQCTASGAYSTVVGFNSSAGGDYSSAFGNQCSASGYSSTAAGYLCNATAEGAVAMGNTCNAQGDNSVAMGHACYASKASSTAMGHKVTVKTEDVFETGYWSGITVRASSIRTAGNSMAVSLRTSDTKIVDGGTITGSEVATTLPRSMYTARVNNAGDQLIFEVNVGGTIKTIAFGLSV
jgi:hypothetical protein